MKIQNHNLQRRESSFFGEINSIISTGYGSQNAIGFVRIIATRLGLDDGYQIARFTSNKIPTPTSIWYAGQNSASISLNTLLDDSSGYNYGGKIDTGAYYVDNNWGIECPVQANIKSDNIDIFIGLNSFS